MVVTVAGKPKMDISTNEKIGKFFGVQPRVTWEVLNPAGNATCFSGDYESEVSKWFSDHLKRFPKSQYKMYHVGKWEHYPNFTGSDADAITIISRLAVRGYTSTLAAHGQALFDFCIDKDRITVAATDELMPDIATAICTAILKMI